jgi:hypothetical protein
MFVGMTFGLIMHWAVLYFKLPFPGYEHAEAKDGKLSNGAVNSYGSINKEKDPLIKESNAQDSAEDNKTLPTWMYFFLAIPSIFDLAATVLCMMGLQYLDVSIYQLLRGSGMWKIYVLCCALSSKTNLTHSHRYYFCCPYETTCSRRPSL